MIYSELHTYAQRELVYISDNPYQHVSLKGIKAECGNAYNCALTVYFFKTIPTPQSSFVDHAGDTRRSFVWVVDGASLLLRWESREESVDLFSIELPGRVKEFVSDFDKHVYPELELEPFVCPSTSN